MVKTKQDDNIYFGAEYSDAFEKYDRAISGHPKNVSAILNCHLVAEYLMDKIIKGMLPGGETLLDESRMSFSSKLFLVKSFEMLESEEINSLKGLNKVRNQCSHQLEYKVSNTDIDLIGKPFGKNYSIIKQREPDRDNLLESTLILPLASLNGACIFLAQNKMVISIDESDTQKRSITEEG